MLKILHREQYDRKWYFMLEKKKPGDIKSTKIYFFAHNITYANFLT